MAFSELNDSSGSFSYITPSSDQDMDDTTNLREKNVDQSVGFGVTRNTYSAHSKFSENTQAEKVVDRTGKPVGESSSSAQIKTFLMNREK